MLREAIDDPVIPQVREDILRRSRISSPRSRNMSSIRETGACSTLVEADEVPYPEGLLIMAIDGNPVSLSFLVTVLRKYRYKVLAQAKATEALEILRRSSNQFDIILTAMVGIDMDVFTLLEVINSKLNMPVVVISASDDQQAIMKAVLYGAQDVVTKPVRVQMLQNIWQHVVRKQLHDHENNHQAFNIVPSNWKKKMSWSPELHRMFVNAVQQLGIDSARPQHILEIMKVEGLTKGNVSSHLQKYRKRVREHNAAQNQENQGGTDPSLNVKFHRLARGQPLSIINQASSRAINPPGVNQSIPQNHPNALQEYRPQGQCVQIPWSEHQPMVRIHPTISAPAQLENHTRSYPEHFHFSNPRMEGVFGSRTVGDPHTFWSNDEDSSSRSQIAHGEDRMRNLPPAFANNNAQFEHQLLEGSRDYPDDELTALVNQFRVDRRPKPQSGASE
ncbi:uncharacterized protein J3R85_005934 [Psidium guajava]|nr:uncharacterized protein J3R85_005934 [Psidium guajava]